MGERERMRERREEKGGREKGRGREGRENERVGRKGEEREKESRPSVFITEASPSYSFPHLPPSGNSFKGNLHLEM